jgi:hypothetical protein
MRIGKSIILKFLSRLSKDQLNEIRDWNQGAKLLLANNQLSLHKKALSIASQPGAYLINELIVANKPYLNSIKNQDTKINKALKYAGVGAGLGLGAAGFGKVGIATAGVGIGVYTFVLTGAFGALVGAITECLDE